VTDDSNTPMPAELKKLLDEAWDGPGWKEAARNHRTEPPPRKRRTKSKKSPPDDNAVFKVTEDALALRFSERHADDLRYVALKAQWLKWVGDRWRPETTLLAFDLVRKSCREDARQYGNGKPLPGISSAKTVAAVERLAKADRRQAAPGRLHHQEDRLHRCAAWNAAPALVRIP
jgi:hypothetical protein